MAYKERLLKTLNELEQKEFESFRWFLHSGCLEGLPNIPKSNLEDANRMQTVDMIVQTYSQQSVEVAKEILKKIRRKDLVEKLTNLCTAVQGKHSVAICTLCVFKKVPFKKMIRTSFVQDLFASKP